LASASEKEIRDRLVVTAKDFWPEARIIHELDVGGCRADLAVVDIEHLFLFEIKSEKDTLSRLGPQVRAFSRSAHATFVVAHERWFETFKYDRGGEGIRPSPDLSSVQKDATGIWIHPELSVGHPLREIYRWRKPGRDFMFDHLRQPRACFLLANLLKDELIEEGKFHGLPVKTSWNVAKIISSMAYEMSGRQIALATCRQLRKRKFAQAEPVC
jgi:hypothetical protein